jgi:hypothetical protein
MPASERDDPRDQDPGATAAPAAFVGPPRPLALTPLTRKSRRPARSHAEAALPLPLKRVLLIAIGVILLAAIVAMGVRSQQRVASEAAALAARQAIEQLERDNRQRAEAERLALAERERQIEAQERARAEQIRAEQSRAEAAQKSLLGEAERRERAWAAYYRKPARCNDVATLECANHYIRARRAFDEKFANGEL